MRLAVAEFLEALQLHRSTCPTDLFRGRAQLRRPLMGITSADDGFSCAAMIGPTRFVAAR